MLMNEYSVQILCVSRIIFDFNSLCFLMLVGKGVNISKTRLVTFLSPAYHEH